MTAPTYVGRSFGSVNKLVVRSDNCSLSDENGKRAIGDFLSR